MKKTSLAMAVVLLSAVSLRAESDTGTLAPKGSSSAEYRFLLSPEDMGGLTSGLNTSGQYGGGQSGYPAPHSRMSRLAIEAGGGFTAPAGNSTNDLTYGYNFRGGAGYKFSPKFSLMGEYEFDRTGIPQAVLQQVGEPGGNVHMWSLTLDPVWNFKTSGSWGGYVTGGGGFYRKLTSFTEPILAQGVYCNYFYCYPVYYTTNVVVGQYSSNQGGLNIGGGVTFGNWNRAKLFAEARYEWLDTPGRSTKIVPVTFGLRW